MKVRLLFSLFAAGACLVGSAHADLIGYQSLDSNAGLTFGTPFAGTNNAAIVAGGKFGGALQLDGDGDFAQVDNVSGLAGKMGSAAKTVSVWYNQTTGTLGLRTPMTFGDNGNGTKFDLDIDNPNSGLEVGVGGGRTTDSGATLNDGSWHNFLVTHSAGAQIGSVNVQVYFDGAVRSVGTNTRPITTTDTRWLFGTAANLGGTAPNLFPNIQFFAGLVDDGAIWDEQFTLPEIQALNFVGFSSLNYSANLFNQMREVHKAGSGSTTIGGTTWSFATGIGANSTNAVIFGAGGSGLTATAIPEPNSLGVLACITGIMGLRRRRR